MISCDVHHIDEDKTNNDPMNLNLVHHSCHIGYHHRNKVVTEETRQRQSGSQKARDPKTRKRGNEHPARVNGSYLKRGDDHWTRTPEGRAKLKEIWKQRKAQRKAA